MSLRSHGRANSRRGHSLSVHTLLLFFLFTGIGSIASPSFAEGTPATEAELIDHGRYLARIAGCNDCHTPGYAYTGGAIPESQWLIGDSLGWRGPWGTTYPGNLRLLMTALTEQQWLVLARNAQYRPPMPWFTLRDMTDRDLRGLYKFVNSLGPAGNAAPDYVPPDRIPSGAYVQFPAAPD